MSLGIEVPMPPPTPEYLESLHALETEGGPEVSFVDLDGEPREPGAIEQQVSRIFKEVDGLRQPVIGEDGSFQETTIVPDERKGPHFITRFRDSEGAVLGVRLSGLAFMGRVTNDHLEIDRLGNVTRHPYEKGEPEPLRLGERIKLFRTLRSIH